MKRGLLAVAGAVLVFGMLAGLAAARGTTTVGMRAHLSVVKLASAKMPNATGQFAGTLRRFSNGRSKLTWTLRYKNLGRRASQAEVVVPGTKAHPGKVYVLLCRPCRLSSHGIVNPILKHSTKVLLTRPGYVVVSTKKYPKGAIRGRIVRTG